ncbi:MAG: 30S ribosomal protein S21 [Deltaproteobacteria bacterium]|nr:30S ribosomal protein S21 [Deltaproteobacteria bacterium]MBM4391382.1 30S ribosomal protein S21 [Deltaproteobacteria bacterium]
MVLVTVRENEPFEKALRRFRRKVEREGIRKDIKKNSFYLKPGEKRRLKQRLAEKRRRKAARRAMRKVPSRPGGREGMGREGGGREGGPGPAST